jgi:hypothetical protein
MDPNLDHVPGGWVGALAGVLAAIGGAYTIWLGRHKAAASDRADIASDNARGGTYEMLARENESLTAENAALREKVSALQRMDALHESRFSILRRDFAIFKQMVIDGVQVELAEKYVQHSALAELDEAPK